MKALIVLGFLTGLDNLQVTPGLGLIRMPPMRRWLLAFAFGLCEAGMPLLGFGVARVLHRSFDLQMDKLAPLVIVACGALIIWLTYRKKEPAALITNPWAIVGLPLLLSVDNFVAGIGVGLMSPPFLFSVLIVAFISTMMSFVGLYAGQTLRRFIPRHAEIFAGLYLVALGLAQLSSTTAG